MSAKNVVTQIASLAGIEINGLNPWDIQVHDERVYDRVLSQASIGLGESYMDGWWDCEKLDEFFYRILSFGAQNKIRLNAGICTMYLASKVFNMQNKARSKRVARQHYDLSNELYMSFLDPYNQYTSGYFEGEEDLNSSQEKALNLICKKICVKPSDNILDIGCGWGGFAKFVAERYGCTVTGISISEEQIVYAIDYCKGLPINIVNCDYRDLSEEFTGVFDKVLIRGMIEHVGYKNYRTLMGTVHRCLNDKPESLFLLDTLGGNATRKVCDRWITRYIFPGGMTPSIEMLGKGMGDLFVMEDWHNFSVSYDKTLIAWFENFDRNWGKIKAKFDNRFYRMFKYYLLSCAGAFRARNLQQWQIVLSKHGVPGGYTSIR
jgi:cyclopropane-fatty-acyl-phospholipid synthase